jgi:hypothetical protein
MTTASNILKHLNSSNAAQTTEPKASWSMRFHAACIQSAKDSAAFKRAVVASAKYGSSDEGVADYLSRLTAAGLLK